MPSLPTFLQPLEQLVARLPSEWLIASGLASQPEPVLESEMPAIARERAILNFQGDAVYLNDGSSYLIQIQFTSPDPAKAAVIANRFATRFIDDQLQGKLSASDKASGWLEQRLAELKTEVQQAEEAVTKFQVEHNIVVTAGSTLNERELSDLNTPAGHRPGRPRRPAGEAASRARSPWLGSGARIGVRR